MVKVVLGVQERLGTQNTPVIGENVLEDSYDYRYRGNLFRTIVYFADATSSRAPWPSPSGRGDWRKRFRARAKS
jgi:hypothetical protein